MKKSTSSGNIYSFPPPNQISSFAFTRQILPSGRDSWKPYRSSLISSPPSKKDRPCFTPEMKTSNSFGKEKFSMENLLPKKRKPTGITPSFRMKTMKQLLS